MKEQEEFQKKIIMKAIKDEKFRKKLKKNPKETIEKELNHIFPKDLRFNIIEQDEKTFNVILPKISNAEKLSDNELQKAIGGGFPPTYMHYTLQC